MSVRVMADVWEVGPSDAVECSVLLALANYCNDDGSNCFPSVPLLAKMTRRSERTVERAITSLEECDWVVVERGVGRGIMSRYHINVDLLKRRQHDAFLANPKRRLPKQEKATSTTLKGDTDANLYRRTIINQPTEPSKPSAPPRKAVAVATTILPAWLDRETWDEFRQMRKRVRAPMTPHAEKLLIDRLTPFASRSKELLERSIVNCWKDIYPESNNGNQQQRAPVKLVETEFKL